ncbi:fungal-specific transcription factor domain-containing protein [Aspergillus cavernicola]|uniref:Fungal-specific transcription factor domain-containing protein n=1 Tax=Aspergillus cavernicola TaxID=176166 RepID=A0ABR4J1M2_9EURO
MLADAPQTDTEQQQPKRRRVTVACVSCRARKSRCSGQRPKCSTCIELGLTCQYVSSGQSNETVVIGKEHFQAIEDRLNQLESLFPHSPSNGRSSKRPQNDVDTPQDDLHSLTPNLTSTGDGSLTGWIGSDDPTDGMGHFVFGDEEDRAYFGPSSNIAFTSDVSRTLKRLSRTRGEFTSSNGHTTLLDFHIARVSRPNSPPPPPPRMTGWMTNNGPQSGMSISSIFYLPPDHETSALIDQYFANTGLLFPYLHEETFRELYAQLKQNHTATRRTWLGVLNMVLALATHTTVLPMGEGERRQMQSEAFYRRASGLCADYVMNGASLEIVQYLLLVSQYMQGNRSSMQTWATHGLAVKIALQLGLHSPEASKRFSPVEREIRKRTWFGCIVLDRSLSMTFGRPASIPEHYCRLELPVYFDGIEPCERQIEARQRCRYSTDFFNSTIRLYSIMGNTLDLLYDGNLGSNEKILNYELITRILRMRHLLEEWIPQLPGHMFLIRGQDCAAQLGKDPAIDRFRIILTLRYHNLRILIHRVVLVRLCEWIDDFDIQDHDILVLQDVTRSTVQVTIDSATEIINIVRTVVESQSVRRGLLGAWWFTLYYTFDAALVLFTILLLAKRSSFVDLCPPKSPDSLKQTFLSCIEPLRRLDEGNRTIDKCCRCLQTLAEVWNVIESNHEQPISQHVLTLPNNPADADTVDQDLSFLDFNFMTNELFDVTDGILSGRGL